MHGTRPAGQWRSNRCETLPTYLPPGGPLGLLTPPVAAYLLTVGLRYGERFADPIGAAMRRPFGNLRRGPARLPAVA